MTVPKSPRIRALGRKKSSTKPASDAVTKISNEPFLAQSEAMSSTKHMVKVIAQQSRNRTPARSYSHSSASNHIQSVDERLIESGRHLESLDSITLITGRPAEELVSHREHSIQDDEDESVPPFNVLLKQQRDDPFEGTQGYQIISDNNSADDAHKSSDKHHENLLGSQVILTISRHSSQYHDDDDDDIDLLEDYADQQVNDNGVFTSAMDELGQEVVRSNTEQGVETLHDEVDKQGSLTIGGGESFRGQRPSHPIFSINQQSNIIRENTAAVKTKMIEQVNKVYNNSFKELKQKARCIYKARASLDTFLQSHTGSQKLRQISRVSQEAAGSSAELTSSVKVLRGTNKPKISHKYINQQ